MVNRTKELLLILVGCAVLSIGINQLILPARLMSGGLTGICIILSHYFHWSVGDLNLILNAPLLILGYRHLGKKFSIYTIIGVILTTVFLDSFHFHKEWTTDVLLNSIFGGVLVGIGGALVLRSGGSTGGLDVIARVVARYKNVSVGMVSLIVNGLIIVFSAYLFNVQTAMFTLISIYTSAKVYDGILNHMDRMTVMIVTSKGEDVSRKITSSMLRGITKWSASGAFTNNQKDVLMCVIVKVQLSELRQMAISVDPDAFMTVMPTQSVVGKFARIW